MSDYFFYDINKKMADLAKKQQLTENAAAAPQPKSKLTEAAADYSAKKAAAGKDIGKPGKNFSKIAAGAAKRYGSAEAGKRVAGAVLNKLRHPSEGVTEGSLEEDKGMTGYNAFKREWRAKHGADAKVPAYDSKEYTSYVYRQNDKKQGVADEGNAFSGAVVKAKRDGVQPGEKIRVGGKQYPVREASAPVYGPGDMEGATAPPAKGKDGQYPIVTSGPHKGKRWSPTTPGPTNPTMKETGGIPQTPKQKSFAKLAPPVDKITFADRIVGAKKEVDEVLGDVAANAMKKAVGQIDWTNLDRGSNKSSTGGRIDTTRPGVTRHHAGKSYSGAGHDAGADDAPTGALGRRKVGAGMGKKIGAKINTGKSKLMTREGDMPEDMFEPQDSGEYDREGSMAKDDIKTVVRHALALEKILGDNDNLPEWVQAKLAKIEGMMTAVDDYMQNQKNGDMETEGKKQHFDKGYYDSMDAAKKDNPKSIVKARKQPFEEESDDTRDSRAEKAGKRVAKDIEYDEKKKDGIHGKRRDSEDDKAEKAGKKVTKDIEYDEKKDKKKDDKKEVDETTTSGSVATGGSAPKSGGGHNYGKGIYDSLNRKLENMISESMSINMSMNNDSHGGPRNTLTVTATDEDATMLAGLLKMAGLGHGDDHIHGMTGDDSDMHAIHAMDQEETCPACGSTSCGCEQGMDESYGDTDATQNEPDWPTDEEGTDDAMMYSGGLNGPKSTGQTTIPVIAGQNDRMGHAGDHELRRMMEIAGLR